MKMHRHPVLGRLDESLNGVRNTHGYAGRVLLAVFLAFAMALWPLAPAANSLAWAKEGSAAGSTFSPMASNVDGIFAGGTGTASNPYIIQTVDQLRAFRDSVNTGTSYQGDTVKLAADLDISGAEWTPIGIGTRTSNTVSGTSTPFEGIFDGAGHTVRGLTISSTTGADNALGFFGVIRGGVVQNLKLTNVSINVSTSDLAGAAVGLSIENSGVSNVEVSGSVSAGSGVGGVVGRMTVSGTITSCTNNATVSATGSGDNVGGIIGAAYYTSLSGELVVSDCKNTGTVTGLEAVGGIVGLSSAFVGQCTNRAAITGSNYSIGGIVGEQRNYGGVNKNTNSGAITNTSTNGYGTGGIVGWVRYNGAQTAYLASSPITVTDNQNSGSIKGGNDGGGIVGVMYNAGVITGNTNSASSISGANFVGGIVGDLQNVDPGALPSTVSVGITVDNNVSSTPLSALSGAYKGLYVYNNDSADFTVTDNGPAWVAEMNGTRFATLPRAVSMASAGGDVSLLADVTDSNTVTMAGPGAVTLNLNGHTVAFTAEPAFNVTGGSLTITGTGKVLSAEDSLQSLVAVDPPSSFVLQGGAYKQDVSTYVGDGYKLTVLTDAADGARYLVESATSGGAGASDSDSDNESNSSTDLDEDDAKSKAANNSNKDVSKTTLAKTGDAATLVIGGFALLAVMAGAVMLLASREHKQA